MKSIGGFFEKFNSKVAGQIQNLILISEIVKKHTKIGVEMKDIAISNGILRLKTSSLEKNEIFMKKDAILKEINQQLHLLSIKDIR